MLNSILAFVQKQGLPGKDQVWNEDQPIRSEIFGEDRLREHAISLANSHNVAKSGTSHVHVLRRIQRNREVLKQATLSLLETVASGGVITPAAEWLVDNSHAAEQHIHQAIEDLPSGYYRQLPKLAEGHLQTYPRVMAIAWAYIAHTDSHFSENTLVDFVNAYQTITPLSIGEIWALAIHLRILLIENAARVAVRTVVSRDARRMADVLIEGSSAPTAMLNDVEEYMSSLPQHAKLSFIVHLLKRARGQRNVDALTLGRLHELATGIGYDAETAAHEEHSRQVANNVTMQNIFTSLKRIAEQDWEGWFEQVSVVDKTLALSPVYLELDGPSRTTYRRAVEDLARHSVMEEEAVARVALNDATSGDPGEVLIGSRRASLEAKIAYRAPLARRLRKSIRQSGAWGYVAAIAFVGLVIVWIGVTSTVDIFVSPALGAVLALLLAAPAFEAAMSMVNFAATQLMRPMVLPGFAFKSGIPPEHRAIIAVPILLSNFHSIEEMLERLEVHYLSNDDPELFYGLISDWSDSVVERSSEDEALLAAAERGIARLKAKHNHERFLLFHRARAWNPAERVWMGWERKRGKLHELNRLLRGAKDTSFVSSAASIPVGIRYVIVLDADTLLPRGAARLLIGKLAHPLNRPVVDVEEGRVRSGYGILQPRVTISLPTLGRGSIYQQIMTGRAGIDPYVFATSDVYQDMFGEGSFTGKGIYEIDAMEASLAGRVPDNTMLSHDLFEGNFARAGLASDVQVVEEFPERYVVDIARQHRWARGDWQLLPWMFPPAKGLSALGLWKMFDNLRRTLTPALTVGAYLVGWCLFSATPALAWTLFMLVLQFVPGFLPIFSGSSLRREPTTLESQLLTIVDDIGSALRLTLLRLVLLVHQSWVMLDAVLRTLYRLSISRTKLLEWMTAAQLQSSLNPSLAETYRLMWISPVMGVFILTGALAPDWISMVALPFSVAWILAPGVAYFISKPPQAHSRLRLSDAASRELRNIALRTWSYFDTHVVAADNMLPPDNVQEDPAPQVAHRTSPTNIGLYMLAVVSARDLGWVGTDEAAARLSATLDTMRKLETYRGHIFNWYDTSTLAPLEPRYISTVDSGNLAGHLIAVANACDVWRQEGLFDLQRLDGLVDIASTLEQNALETGRAHKSALKQSQHACSLLSAMSINAQSLKTAPDVLALRLVSLGVQINAIEQSLRILWNDASLMESATGLYWVGRLRNCFEALLRETTRTAAQQSALAVQLEALARNVRSFAYGMDFRFLMNAQRHLLSIGYRMSDESLDQSCYDLMASEAVLTSFLAIAKGDVEARHWVRLGRPVVAVDRAACLVSWSGSMFEYLMPLLVMRSPDGTLTSQTMDLVVSKQIAYARSKDTPWGISESAYAARDRHFVYQYSNFGVPGLGLKRGLGDNHVIAPYATGLAAMIAPGEAVENYRRLETMGVRGRHGFYEAVDFTPSRLRAGQSYEIIRAYFAHHQGMTIAALHNAVSGGTITSYFHRENTVKATELLLQERAPNHLPLKVSGIDQPLPVKGSTGGAPEAARIIDPASVEKRITHLLSNGRYTTMLTAAGEGYSRWNGIAINRWREDPTTGGGGIAVVVRDLATGRSRPVAGWPGMESNTSAQVIFSEEKAEFLQTGDGLTTQLECLVSTEDDSEARCLSLINTSDEPRTVEYTTYAELALAHPLADDAHPAFSKLFVVTEYVPELQALIATRRIRQENDPRIWVAQFVVTDNETAGKIEYETSREAFLGRGNPLTKAAALNHGRQLTSTTGTVLDPVFALRQRVILQPHRKTRCVIWTIAADSREALLEKVSRHSTISVFERVQILAWTQARILLRHLSIDVNEANLFQHLASAIIYSSPNHRPPPKSIVDDMRLQSTLWPQSISGNRPMVVVRIRDADDATLVEQILRAQLYWQEKRLAVDVIIVNERPASYIQDLQNLLDGLVSKARVNHSIHPGGEHGEIFLLRSDLLHREVVGAIFAAARVVLDASQGKLERQLAPKSATQRSQRRAPAASIEPRPVEVEQRRADETAGLEFFNDIGGFGADGSEYVILHGNDRPLPAPWINVIANPRFGTHCSAEGGGYTWYRNSRERQITPWSNDAVSDPAAEAFYILDLDRGILISPTVLPLGRRAGRFRTRHGFGYTVHEAREQGLDLEFVTTVAVDDAVKCMRLKISNPSSSVRKLRVTYLAEIIMGQRRAATAHFITSDVDPMTNALLLRNRWSADFNETIVFADMSGRHTSWSGNRRSVLGHDGGMAAPAGLLSSQPLAQETGGGYDPCAALQTDVQVLPGASEEVVVYLGAAESIADVQALVTRCRSTRFDQWVSASRALWKSMLGNIQVKTPDRAFDIMMNGWLIYQTVSCRMWARSGFYQASGAYGFRDQLQDGMTLAHVRPDLARSHILTAASRQFLDGDFQHWWLPETGAGVRTRISDDTVWLAHCVAYYVELTGDFGILDEQIPFLTGPQLAENEHDAFFIPGVTVESVSLYQHCVLGLSRNLPSGSNGLPLMGTGDWNDGMNRVGEHGQGESVWLGWFLIATLAAFERIAERRLDQKTVELWSNRRNELAGSLDLNGWDGGWYRRAFFDDGTPLGTSEAEECRIDTIAQSWAVLSGMADMLKARKAMQSVEDHLIDWEHRIAHLFWPPFRNHTPDPGYIQSYPPGIRENGGQYSHGAIWGIFAFSKLNETEKAAKLFSLINPINHALTSQDAWTYRTEPYVVAADIYSVMPHRGRGGWTWYTGASGWSYRAGLEAVLGIRRSGTKLRIKPCIPLHWPKYEAYYRYGSKSLHLIVTRVPDEQTADIVLIPRNGQFEIELGRAPETARYILRLT